MGEFMRLDEWDDFREIANNCTNVFFQTTALGDHDTELVAYASRVYWKSEMVNEDVQAYLDDLKVLRGKRVLETSDSVFR